MVILKEYDGAEARDSDRGRLSRDGLGSSGDVSRDREGVLLAPSPLPEPNSLTPFTYKTFVGGYGEYLLRMIGDPDVFLSRALDMGLGLFRIELPCPPSERLSQPRCELAPFNLALMLCRRAELDDGDLTEYADSKSYKPPESQEELNKLGTGRAIVAYNRNFITSMADKYSFVYTENPFFNTRDTYWQTTGSPVMWVVLHVLAARVAISRIEHKRQRDLRLDTRRELDHRRQASDTWKSAIEESNFSKKFDLLFATLFANLEMFISCNICRHHFASNIKRIAFRDEIYEGVRYKTFVSAEPDAELVKFHAHVNSRAVVNRLRDERAIDVDEFVKMYRYSAMYLAGRLAN